MKFELGKVVMTVGANTKLDLSDDDKQENEIALKQNYRLLGSYEDANGVKFWIITEADRRCTTILLPEEY